VTEADLAGPTRNEGRMVRDEMAHVIASDVDLIPLLEAARDAREVHLDEQRHNDETSRWADATPQAFVEALHRGAARWRGLLASLPVPPSTSRHRPTGGRRRRPPGRYSQTGARTMPNMLRMYGSKFKPLAQRPDLTTAAQP
jgi:hypothetical protein